MYSARKRMNRAILHGRAAKQDLLVWVCSSSAGPTPPYLSPHFAERGNGSVGGPVRRRACLVEHRDLNRSTRRDKRRHDEEQHDIRIQPQSRPVEARIKGTRLLQRTGWMRVDPAASIRVAPSVMVRSPIFSLVRSPVRPCPWADATSLRAFREVRAPGQM